MVFQNGLIFQKTIEGLTLMDNIIINLYVLVDDFIKKLKKMPHFEVPRLGKVRCGRKRNLSLSEIVTLGIFRFYFDFTSWKHYHKVLMVSYKDYFPELTNYENFMKYLNVSFGLVVLIVNVLLKQQKGTHDIQFIDSTSLPVCDNKRINTHKVCTGAAERGHSSKGWYYGFKLHAVCDLDGDLLSILITPGNTDDRKYLDKILDGLNGLVVGDAGYLSKDLVRHFLEKDILLLTGVRKNMNKLMSKPQHDLLKCRQIIESVFSILKTRMNMATNLARSITGLFRHYMYCILAYMLNIRNNQKLMIENQ